MVDGPRRLRGVRGEELAVCDGGAGDLNVGGRGGAPGWLAGWGLRWLTRERRWRVLNRGGAA